MSGFPYVNRQYLFDKYPNAVVTPDCFKLQDEVITQIDDGEVLVRNHYLSLDPYMRGRMSKAKNYAAGQELNTVMQGGTVGEVVVSKHAGFKAGDTVLCTGGWQLYFRASPLTDSNQIHKIDVSRIPMSVYLGAAGMPGITAWYGLNKIIKPQSGETLVVSAASGAVGSVVGQLAKQKGCHVIGIAGGPEKCDYVVETLGFDDCIDYKAYPDTETLSHELKQLAPNGVDAYYENVGGYIMDAVLENLNPFSRVAICGLIAGYDGRSIPISNPRAILVSRASITGFIISDHLDIWPQALADLAEAVANGVLIFKESVSNGLESAPEAFMGLLQGHNFGKQLVKLV